MAGRREFAELVYTVCRSLLVFLFCCSLSTGYMLHKVSFFSFWGLQYPNHKWPKSYFRPEMNFLVFKLHCICGITYHNNIQITDIVVNLHIFQILSRKRALRCVLPVQTELWADSVLSLAPSGVFCGHGAGDRCFHRVCGAQRPG